MGYPVTMLVYPCPTCHTEPVNEHEDGVVRKVCPNGHLEGEWGAEINEIRRSWNAAVEAETRRMLKPCPVCGLEPQRQTHNSFTYEVICTQGHLRSPGSPSDEQAIKAWNAAVDDYESPILQGSEVRELRADIERANAIILETRAALKAPKGTYLVDHAKEIAADLSIAEASTARLREKLKQAEAGRGVYQRQLEAAISERNEARSTVARTSAIYDADWKAYREQIEEAKQWRAEALELRQVINALGWAPSEDDDVVEFARHMREERDETRNRYADLQHQVRALAKIADV